MNSKQRRKERRDGFPYKATRKDLKHDDFIAMKKWCDERFGSSNWRYSWMTGPRKHCFCFRDKGNLMVFCLGYA